MTSSLPSPKRVIMLVLGTVTVACLGAAGAFVALGVLADREAYEAAQAEDAATLWMDMTDRFEHVAMADPFLLPETGDGDAAALYWPAESGSVDACEVPHAPRLYDYTEMLFERWPADMEQATHCPRIDDMVRAAGMPRLDMVARLGAGNADFDYFASPSRIREPHHALLALLTRAHAGIRARDWADAERDARAVVSAGRQLIWNSIDVNGVAIGLDLMSGGLDHLRVLHERRGDIALAARALAARDTIEALAHDWESAIDVARRTSAFPGLLRYTVAAAENEGLPLGMRSAMVVLVGYGHIGHSLERMLWPSHDRTRALTRLERFPRLMPAIAQARKGLSLSWFERRDLSSQWNLL
ncbi:MAG: hypothetical protein PVH00_11980 [Gemmatimonadota bacterium]|jgi:hypothetical protein